MEYYSASETSSLLKKHDFKFSKAKGQNFLIDKNITEKITRLSGIDKSFCVLEVGPGLGALTTNLCRVSGRVVAVELDQRIVPLLEETLSDFDNYTIICDDILKLDIGTLLKEHAHGFRYALCANLPYNITTPAITGFIESGVFETITIMIQREVAHRLCAAPGTSDYGSFTVYVNYHTQPRLLFDVPPECFMPKPKVHSSVITLKARDEHPIRPESEKLFFKVVRAAFAQRRKTLANALHGVFGNELAKSEVTEIITANGFDGRIRGETLGIADFIKIADAIYRLTIGS